MAPMRALDRPKPAVSVERRPDGTLDLSAGRPLPDGLPLVTRRVLEHRAPDVARLYAGPSDDRVIVAEGSR